MTEVEQRSKDNKQGVILVVLASMALIVMFVEIMIVPALPTMARDFPDQVAWLPWVLSIYLLVGAVATPLVGRLGDLYGKKKVLSYVMVIYLVALLGSGFSLEISDLLFGTHDISVLLFFRAMQGIGMGMFTLAFGIVRDTFPKDKIPVAVGMISAMFSVGVAIGLVVGGYITSVARWTDAFHVVVPFFLVLTIAAAYLIHDPRIVQRGKLDIPGGLTLGVAILALLLGLTQGDKWGWTDPATLGLFAAFAIAITIFVVIELRTKDPIVRPSLMVNRGILGGNVVALFVGLCMFMVYQTVPFFLETPVAAGGYFGLTDTFTVGLYMLPSALAQLFFGPYGGKLSKKMGPSTVLAIGMAILTAGFVSLVFFNADFWQLTLSMVIFGSGIALCMVSMINVIVESCPQSEFGVASGMNTLFRIVGGSIGPVLAAVILASHAFPFQVAPGIYVNFFAIEGYIQTWWVGFAFALIGLIAAIFLRPRPADRCDIPPEDLPPADAD
ncbi:MAG: MFS transporter [Methanomassiliicoccus sp.]|nr:MFS transporter [Methanomassiliicoccus sp.]